MFLTEAFRKVFVDVELKAVGKESAAAAAAGKESKLENAVMRIAGVVGLERGSWVWVHSYAPFLLRVRFCQSIWLRY